MNLNQLPVPPSLIRLIKPCCKYIKEGKRLTVLRSIYTSSRGGGKPVWRQLQRMQTKQEINAEGNGENTRRQINRITVSMEKALPKKTKKNLQQTHAAAGLSAAALFSAANNISGKPIRADAEKRYNSNKLITSGWEGSVQHTNTVLGFYSSPLMRMDSAEQRGRSDVNESREEKNNHCSQMFERENMEELWLSAKISPFVWSRPKWVVDRQTDFYHESFQNKRNPYSFWGQPQPCTRKPQVFP